MATASVKSHEHLDRGPFAPSNLIVRPAGTEADNAVLVIDPWSQRWAIVDSEAERILTLADGRRSLCEISSDAGLIRKGSATPEEVVDQLIGCGILFESQADHRRSGQPVYNASDIQGIHLEITNACNLRCRHCYVSSGQKLPDELSDAELRMVVDQLPSFSGRAIAISGGEPAVRKGCLDLVEYCAVERGHDVDLYTNGYKFPRRFAERLIGIAERSPGELQLQVSLEGATDATNDLIRGRGAFARTTETLEMFRELGLNRQTTVFVCITKLNIDQLDRIIALCERLDVARLHFSQWQRQGNASDVPWESIAPTVEEWLEAGERVLSYTGERLDMTGNFFGDLKNTPSGRFTLEPSLFPKHLYFYNAFPRISPDGWIFADQFWTNRDWALGNVREMTLAEAFDSPTFHAQLDAMRARTERVADCGRCIWRDLCGSGSPGHTYAEYGHLWEKDLFCDARMRWFERYADTQIERVLDAA